jgi:hypothetical protein
MVRQLKQPQGTAFRQIAGRVPFLSSAVSKEKTGRKPEWTTRASTSFTQLVSRRKRTVDRE